MSTAQTAAYREFLKRLRQARADAKLTQTSVAKKLRKPQSFMAKIESGERRLDFIEVQRLAKIYDKPLSFFQP